MLVNPDNPGDDVSQLRLKPNLCRIVCQHVIYDIYPTAGSSLAASGRLDLGPSVLATCVLEKETLRVFYDNGDDYPIPLQFPVKRC